jgi:predicted GNAT family acetyltransferase
MGGYRPIVDVDLYVFVEHAMPWLLTDPVANNLLCTIVQSRLDGVMPMEPDGLWVRVLDAAGELSGVCLRTPPRGLVMSPMSAGAAQALADLLAACCPQLPGVDGPQAASDAFAARFCALTGASATGGLSARLYRLDAVVPPDPAEGHLREAKAGDRDLMVAWSEAFGAEALPHQPHGDSAAVVDRAMAQGGRVWIWEAGGKPMSTVWLSRPAAGVSRIGPVYTPPHLRGHGYASCAVAAVCEYALGTGSVGCMLFADRTNATTNRIYQRIGFRPAGDHQEWMFGG